MRCKSWHLSSLDMLMPLKLSNINSHDCFVPHPPALSLMRTHFQHTHTRCTFWKYVGRDNTHTHLQTTATQHRARRFVFTQNCQFHQMHSSIFVIYLNLPVANVLADFATLHCSERTPQFRYLFFHSLFMHYSFLDCQCATHQIENSKRKRGKKYISAS